MRGLEVLPGFKHAVIEYERDARFAGKPKYSYWASLKLAIDGITSFSSRPLKLVSLLGIAGILFSLGLGLYAVISKFVFSQNVIRGWTSLLIAFS